MKKRSSLFLKILAIYLTVAAVMCFIFAVMYHETPDTCENIANVDVSEITEYTTLYCEELEILQRYAFETFREYKDSDGTYIDTTYYVYDGSQPMDKNELLAEYYIVKFSDKTGREYITSLSVDADKKLSATLKDTPLTITACVGASSISNYSSSKANAEQLLQLREDALDGYSQASQISRAPIKLGYQAKNVEEYQENFNNSVAASRIIATVFGVVLFVISILLWRRIRNKVKQAENFQ